MRGGQEACGVAAAAGCGDNGTLGSSSALPSRISQFDPSLGAAIKSAKQIVQLDKDWSVDKAAATIKELFSCLQGTAQTPAQQCRGSVANSATARSAATATASSSCGLVVAAADGSCNSLQQLTTPEGIQVQTLSTPNQDGLHTKPVAGTRAPVAALADREQAHALPTACEADSWPHEGATTGASVGAAVLLGETDATAVSRVEPASLHGDAAGDPALQLTASGRPDAPSTGQTQASTSRAPASAVVTTPCRGLDGTGAAAASGMTAAASAAVAAAVAAVAARLLQASPAAQKGGAADDDKGSDAAAAAAATPAAEGQQCPEQCTALDPQSCAASSNLESCCPQHPATSPIAHTPQQATDGQPLQHHQLPSSTQLLPAAPVAITTKVPTDSANEQCRVNDGAEQQLPCALASQLMAGVVQQQQQQGAGECPSMLQTDEVTGHLFPPVAAVVASVNTAAARPKRGRPSKSLQVSAAAAAAATPAAAAATAAARTAELRRQPKRQARGFPAQESAAPEQEMPGAVDSSTARHGAQPCRTAVAAAPVPCSAETAGGVPLPVTPHHPPLSHSLQPQQQQQPAAVGVEDEISSEAAMLRTTKDLLAQARRLTPAAARQVTTFAAQLPHNLPKAMRQGLLLRAIARAVKAQQDMTLMRMPRQITQQQQQLLLPQATTATLRQPDVSASAFAAVNGGPCQPLEQYHSAPAMSHPHSAASCMIPTVSSTTATAPSFLARRSASAALPTAVRANDGHVVAASDAQHAPPGLLRAASCTGPGSSNASTATAHGPHATADMWKPQYMRLLEQRLALYGMSKKSLLELMRRLGPLEALKTIGMHQALLPGSGSSSIAPTTAALNTMASAPQPLPRPDSTCSAVFSQLSLQQQQQQGLLASHHVNVSGSFAPQQQQQQQQPPLLRSASLPCSTPGQQPADWARLADALSTAPPPPAAAAGRVSEPAVMLGGTLQWPVGELMVGLADAADAAAAAADPLSLDRRDVDALLAGIDECGTSSNPWGGSGGGLLGTALGTDGALQPDMWDSMI